MSAIVGGALGDEAGDQMQLLEEGWDQRAPLGLEHEGPDAGRARRCCALLSDWLPATTGTDHLRRRRRAARSCSDGYATPWTSMPSCCCPSAGRRRPSRCGRSWRTSPAAAASRPSGSTTVAEHYLHFGGVSPINGINRALIEQLSRHRRSICRSTSATATGSRTSRTPWRRCATTGFAGRRYSPRRRGAATPAARSTSRTSRGPARRPASGAPELVKLRQYFDHPLFVEMFADAVAAAAQTLPDRPARRRPAGVHRALHPGGGADPVAAPTSTAARSAMRRGWSPPRPATPTTTRCGSPAPGRRRCRGWSPTSPTTCALAERGTKAVIVCPIGFVADHIEVVWDLDNELRQQADSSGHRVRAGGDAQRRPPVRATGGRPDRRTARRPRAVRVAGPDAPPLQGFSINGAFCTPRLWRAAAAQRCHAECSDRADRGQPRRTHHRRPADAARRWRSAPPTDVCSADRHQSGADGDDRVDVRGVLQHPQRPRRCVVGSLVQRARDSSTCSTSPRGSSTSSRRRRRAGRPTHRRPTAPPSAARTRPRRGRGARRTGASGSEYTVHDSAHGSAARRDVGKLVDRFVVLEVGHQADCGRHDRGRRRSPRRRRSRHGLKQGARGKPADVAGHRQRDATSRVAGAATGPPRCAGSAAARPRPASLRSGHGRPVLSGRHRVIGGHGMSWRPLG